MSSLDPTAWILQDRTSNFLFQLKEASPHEHTSPFWSRVFFCPSCSGVWGKRYLRDWREALPLHSFVAVNRICRSCDPDLGGRLFEPRDLEDILSRIDQVPSSVLSRLSKELLNV